MSVRPHPGHEMTGRAARFVVYGSTAHALSRFDRAGSTPATSRQQALSFLAIPQQSHVLSAGQGVSMSEHPTGKGPVRDFRPKAAVPPTGHRKKFRRNTGKRGVT